MSINSEREFKIVIGVFSLLVGIIGWSINHTLSGIEGAIDKAAVEIRDTKIDFTRFVSKADVLFVEYDLRLTKQRADIDKLREHKL